MKNLAALISENGNLLVSANNKFFWINPKQEFLSFSTAGEFEFLCSVGALEVQIAPREFLLPGDWRRISSWVDYKSRSRHTVYTVYARRGVDGGVELVTLPKSRLRVRRPTDYPTKACRAWDGTEWVTFDICAASYREYERALERMPNALKMGVWDYITHDVCDINGVVLSTTTDWEDRLEFLQTIGEIPLWEENRHLVRNKRKKASALVEVEED